MAEYEGIHGNTVTGEAGGTPIPPPPPQGSFKDELTPEQQVILAMAITADRMKDDPTFNGTRDINIAEASAACQAQYGRWAGLLEALALVTHAHEDQVLRWFKEAKASLQ